MFKLAVYTEPQIQIYVCLMKNYRSSVKHNLTFICGDINIDLFKYESHQASKGFVNQLFSSGY